MEEKNTSRLKWAIKGLKTYEPPQELWCRIEETLNKEKSHERLKLCIQALPQYKAPDNIWTQIENQLEVLPSSKKSIIRSISWRWIVTAAALTGLVLSTSHWFFNQDHEVVQYFYSVEIVNDGLLKSDWDDNKEAFELVMESCKTKQFICEDPEFKNQRKELEELNKAKEVLIIAMKNYGRDAEIIAQITHLEHERSDLLKKMISKI